MLAAVPGSGTVGQEGEPEPDAHGDGNSLDSKAGGENVLL